MSLAAGLSVHSVAEEAGAGTAWLGLTRGDTHGGFGSTAAPRPQRWGPERAPPGPPEPPGWPLWVSAGRGQWQTASGRRAQEFEDGLQAALPGQQRLIRDNSITAPCHEGVWGRLGGPAGRGGLGRAARTSAGWGGPVAPTSAGRVLYPTAWGC